MNGPDLQARLKRLRDGMDRDGITTAIISHPRHIYYFTGSMPPPISALLLVTPTRLLGIGPSQLGDIETLTFLSYDIHHGWNVSRSVADLLERGLSVLGVSGGKGGFEWEHLPGVWLAIIRRHLDEALDLKDLLWGVRRIRDDFEIQQIRDNIAGNDQIFQMLSEMLHPGVQEMDVWGAIQTELNKNAGEPTLLEADLGVGVRGVIPAAKPGKETLKPGEAIFADIYSASHHYYADTTRVFTLGQPDDQQKQIHAILLEAMEAGVKKLFPGTPANQVDAAVRGRIALAGYGDNFPHHSGHAYNLFQQDRPYFIPAESTPIETGMIVTLEPGIYIPGWGGMRVESNFLIEQGGPRRLDTYPLEITICPQG